MEEHIKAIYSRWNAKDLEGVLAAFRALGPGGFTIEYIGSAPLAGEPAVRDMWEKYGGTCTTDIAQLIVNGDEAAAVIDNNLHANGGVTNLPSIETYRVTDGVLAVRYYHATPQAA